MQKTLSTSYLIGWKLLAKEEAICDLFDSFAHLNTNANIGNGIVEIIDIDLPCPFDKFSISTRLLSG